MVVESNTQAHPTRTAARFKCSLKQPAAVSGSFLSSWSRLACLTALATAFASRSSSFLAFHAFHLGSRARGRLFEVSHPPKPEGNVAQ